MRRVFSVMRGLRAPLLVVSVVLVSVNGMWAGQTTAPTSMTPVESDFVKWALTQGGLVVVLLGTLWSYRRDMVRLLHEEEAQTQVLMGIVEKSTTALIQLTDEIKRCPFHEH